MIVLFLIAIVLIAFLVFIMFIILKSTVNKINEQTKLYFVDKLQDYNNIIDKKEEKLKELDEEIKKLETTQINNDIEINKKDYDFDYSIINLLNKTEYQNENILKIAKEIDNKFDFNYEEIIKKFVSMTSDNEKIYDFCVNLRKKFDSELIYKLKTMDNYEDYLMEMLNNNEKLIYNHFKLIYKKINIDNFINYLEELIDLNNPMIFVYVGDKHISYDNISKYIKTKYVSNIYKGIKILYKNKIYDFSLNEGNV